MKGKVLFFSQESGKGVLIAQDGNKYEFGAQSWDDYENMPKGGLEIEFTPKNGAATNINSKTTNKTQDREATKEQSAKRADQRGEQRGDQRSDQKRALKRAGKNIITKIRAEVSVVDCINNYFEDYLEVLQRNQSALGEEKVLDYFKMRRFMITAYNNLRQLDRSIQSNDFKEVEADIKFLERVYKSIKKITNQPKEVAFEKIFLLNQKDYKIAKDMAISFKNKIDSSGALEKILRNEIKKKEENLMVLQKDSEEFNSASAKLKPVKKQYADTIYEISLAKENLIYISELMQAFRVKYFEPFCDLFEQNLKYYSVKIVKIMNAKAYEFDYTLWKNAKESPYIRKFFADCDIDGTYSSKTFLKYYIKSLDKEKLSSDNRKLLDLLNYLESSYTKRIAVVTKDSDSASSIKVAIENIDKDLYVVSSTSPVDIINISKNTNFDLVIFDYELKLMNGFDFVELYKKNHKVGLSDFCVIYTDEELKFMRDIQDLGIHYSLKRPVSQKELRDKLKLVL